MPVLRVETPGLFTTVQDRGRIGFRNIGVPTSGVLDAQACALANALVGNATDAAVLECLGAAPALVAEDGPVRVALWGSAARALVTQADGTARPLPAGQSVTLAPGDRLAIGPLRDTFCLTIAVEGGFDVPPVLGSRSTYVRGGFGGLSGRPLRAGDLVPAGSAATGRSERRLAFADGDEQDRPVRIVLGPQQDAFTPEGVAAFLCGPYALTNNADRMGFRFEGPKITHRAGPDIVSDGAVAGSIQVPGSGQPIVLLADGQSVGGYTKIATVISADLPRLVRRRPGQPVRFMAVSQAEAEQLAREAALAMQGRVATIEDVVEGLDVQALYDRNLVSGVTAAV